MFRIVFTEQALADIDRLEDWLLDHGASYGAELGVALEATIGGLTNYPERGNLSRSGRYRERYLIFHSNQYVIQYQVKGGAVVIARIFHSLEDR